MKKIILVFFIFAVIFSSCEKEIEDPMSLYEETGYLPEDKVEEYIESQISISNKTFVKINGEKQDVTRIDIINDNSLYIMTPKHYFIFKATLFGEKIKNVYMGELDEEGDFYFENRDDFKKKNLKIEKENDFHLIKGNYLNGEDLIEIEMNIHIDSLVSSGYVELYINEDNKVAFLSGTLGTSSYVLISEMVKNRSDIKNLVLTYVPGSMNDLINVHTGRLLRENNITTIVPMNGKIYSGGVDLFSSGKKRILFEGGEIGVHSWCCGGNDEPADEIPEDDEAHKSQIEYFTKMLGEENGRDFYFYTLKAAPFHDIYKMNLEEIEKYNLATKIIPIENNFEENYISYGNENSDKVLIYIQGGPELTLNELTFYQLFSKVVDENNVRAVTIHQVQTKNLSFVPYDKKVDYSLSKSYSSKNVEMIKGVVDKFKKQNKKVYFVGISYGSILLKEYLSKYGNEDIEGIAFFVGRIKQEEEVSNSFKNGIARNFQTGEEYEIPIMNSNRLILASSIFFNDYTQKLKDIEFKNTYYVYSKDDEKIKGLNKEELDFLKSKNIKIIESNLTHFTATTDNFNLVVNEILNN